VNDGSTACPPSGCVEIEILAEYKKSVLLLVAALEGLGFATVLG
jgi:hypothetical protein